MKTTSAQRKKVNEPATKQLSLKLPQPLVDAVDLQAAACWRTRTNMIMVLLEEALQARRARDADGQG